MSKKWLFYSFWFLLLIYPAIVVINNSLPLNRVLADKSLTLNLLMRISGLMVLTILPIQVFIGGNMTKLTEKFGGWFFSFHIFEAMVIYGLVISYQILFVIYEIPIRGIDPVYVFTDFCVACQTRLELWYTFERVGFWILTLTYFVAKYRTNPVLQRNWHLIHLLNYFVFFLFGISAYFVGTDIHSKLYFWYFILANVLVFALLMKKLIKIFKVNFVKP